MYLETNYTIKFRGIDDFNRPVYKVQELNVYLGSTEVLFPDKEIAPNGTTEEINNYFKDNLDKLCIFGNSFNCEPLGNNVKKNINLIII